MSYYRKSSITTRYEYDRKYDSVRYHEWMMSCELKHEQQPLLLYHTRKHHQRDRSKLVPVQYKLHQQCPSLALIRNHQQYLNH